MQRDKPLGCPSNLEPPREVLKTVSFKADADTRAAIKILTQRARANGIVRPRSVAIRTVLIEAADKIREVNEQIEAAFEKDIDEKLAS